MRRFTIIKVIAVFALTLAMAVAAYWITSKNLSHLLETIRESSTPDLVLIKVKELYSDITGAESGIRAFTLTQDEKYLEPYQNLVNTIDKKIDTLRALTADKTYEIRAVDSISALMQQKIKVYDKLLRISYSKVLQSAFGKITSQFSLPDSISTDTIKALIAEQKTEEKKGFLKKLFKPGPSKKELELVQKAEQAQQESEKSKQKISNVQRAITDISEKESLQLKEQTKAELALLDKDKEITHEIENLIRKIEYDESLQISRKAEEANSSANESGKRIMFLTICGSAFLLLLIGLILYDIAKSDLYRKQLAIAKAHAEKLAKIKEEFLANMSHEIRTPLSAILGYTDRLLKTNLNEKQTGYTKAINTSSEHLLSIVNDILDLTKIETNNLRFEKIRFKPEMVVKDVCEALQFKAEEKDISLICNLDNIKGITVKGDPLRLKQVLFNLIGNAIKFTEKGGVKLEIGTLKLGNKRINNEPQISNFKFQISDTGIGIPEEKLKSIFAQFSQADMSISRKFGGSGLGLNISKRIIEMQGGTIEVKSKVMKGSEFTFVIPYEVTEEQEMEMKPESRIQNPGTRKPLQGIRILLAEDVEINRILQKEMLRDSGAMVIEVTNGLEVISELKINSTLYPQSSTQLAANNYHLILMDIQMPGMDGVETVKRIRGELNSPIPVIAMTANVMQHDLDGYLEAGFTDYITKPFKEKDLIDKIVHVLEKKHSSFKIIANKEELSHTNELFSLAELYEASGGSEEFVIKMIKLFIANSETSLKKLETNISQQDFHQINIIAHKLIPSYGMLNIGGAVKDLQFIQTNSAKDKNIEEIISKFNNIKAVTERVVVGLQEQMGKISV